MNRQGESSYVLTLELVLNRKWCWKQQALHRKFSLSYCEIANLKLLYGKETVSLGDFFTIKGSITDGKVVWQASQKVNYLGFRMGQAP